jgi:acylphosphatase
MSDYDSKIIRKRIRVFGSVQGVGFRYRTEHAAESVGATGWVRNELDGSVLMEIQGTEEQIDKVFAMVSQGTYVNIEKMDARTIPLVDDENDFRTRGSSGHFFDLFR